MINLKILGVYTDLRTDTPVVYCQTSIPDYFSLIGQDFDKFSIQRRREKHPAYARMMADIQKGVLLPTITLAPQLPKAAALKEAAKAENLDIAALANSIVDSGHLNILDGLQRTYVLKDLEAVGHVFLDQQTLHLEIRIEPDIKHLIYRIIVLNAGQKPMSMRHQIEILFLSFQSTLENQIQNLELFTENDNLRRTRSRKFALDRIAGGYHAYLLATPEVEKQNVVAQRITEGTVLETDEEALGAQFIEFSDYLSQYCRLDDEVCRIYDGSRQDLPTGTTWFGNENVINAFFAAVSDYGTNESRRNRVSAALVRLFTDLQAAPQGSDPLGLEKFQEIAQAFPVRKINVGSATRKLLHVSFKEFFRDEGETPIAEIWQREAD